MNKGFTPRRIVINRDKTRLDLYVSITETYSINGLFGFSPGSIRLISGAANLNVNGTHYSLHTMGHERLSWRDQCLITFKVTEPSDMVISFYKNAQAQPYIEAPLGLTHMEDYEETSLNSSLKRVKQFMIANANKNITLKDMSEVANLSIHHLVRAFKKVYGLPPHSFLRVIRCFVAFELLMFHEMKGIDVAFECGFCDQSHFIREAKVTFGLSPKKLSKLAEVEQGGYQEAAGFNSSVIPTHQIRSYPNYQSSVTYGQFS